MPACEAYIHAALAPDIKVEKLRLATRCGICLKLDPPWLEGSTVATNFLYSNILRPTLFINQHSSIGLKEIVVLHDNTCN